MRREPFSITISCRQSKFKSQGLSNRSTNTQHPFLLANQVGANDDLLFDGCSLVAWPNGTVVIAPAWQEGVLLSI